MLKISDKITSERHPLVLNIDWMSFLFLKAEGEYNMQTFLLIVIFMLIVINLKQADELRDLERKTLDAFKIVWFAGLRCQWQKKQA